MSLILCVRCGKPIAETNGEAIVVQRKDGTRLEAHAPITVTCHRTIWRSERYVRCGTENYLSPPAPAMALLVLVAS